MPFDPGNFTVRRGLFNDVASLEPAFHLYRADDSIMNIITSSNYFPPYFGQSPDEIKADDFIFMYGVEGTAALYISIIDPAIPTINVTSVNGLSKQLTLSVTGASTFDLNGIVSINVFGVKNLTLLPVEFIINEGGGDLVIAPTFEFPFIPFSGIQQLAFPQNIDGNNVDPAAITINPDGSMTAGYLFGTAHYNPSENVKWPTLSFIYA